jgi:hypothetical protein
MPPKLDGMRVTGWPQVAEDLLSTIPKENNWCGCRQKGIEPLLLKKQEPFWSEISVASTFDQQRLIRPQDGSLGTGRVALVRSVFAVPLSRAGCVHIAHCKGEISGSL